jgi:cellobiose phosphorylase
MMNKYGHFSQDGSEFIIATPLTPHPWINYLTNSRYCAIISQCAGGYSFYRDCRTDRILRWSPENWHFDRPGRYIYIKEPQNARRMTHDAKVWSATYQPLCVKPDFYRCRHGFGYTVIESRYFGIGTEITYFVPENDDCEVWIVRIKNETKKPRTLEIYPYIEWLLGDYHQELRYRNIMNLYNRIWLDSATHAIFAKKTAFWQDMNILPLKGNAFFASSLGIQDYWVRKDGFLGRYNTEMKPEAIMANQVSEHRESRIENRECSGEDGVAVFKHSLHLKVNHKEEFTIVLGQLQTQTKINSTIKKYRNLQTAKRELENTKAIWRRRILNNLVVRTPNKELDLLVNSWLKYQIYICNFWSRSPSYYHEGSGGRGYRDSAQDGESILSLNLQISRQKILKLASLNRRDGTSAPGWSDTQGPHQFRPNKDHQIWLTSLVYAYIQETGDKDILKKKIPYLKDKWIDGWRIDPNFHNAGSYTDGEGTLFEHLEANLNFTFNDVGDKGLPLIGHADWNDAIDAAGIKLKGQSVWLAQALVRSLKMLAELANLINKKQKAKDYLNKARVMSERINKVAWDGNWYLRGFTDSGSVYGSNSNSEGKIFINPQAWALMSGVADSTRQRKVVSSVKRYLDGPHGLALFHPAYSRFNPELGRISMFSQGTKENAAVFVHAAIFMIVGLLQAGFGNLAYSTLLKILPNQQKDYDLYKTEPYAMAEYLVGPQHHYLYGQGAFTWITGSAGWSFMAITEWLLGVRHDFAGLRINPCIPSQWKKFSIRRPFRRAIYEIEVENPQGVQRGIKKIYVDGKRIEGNLIKPRKDGKIHKVCVTMG